MNFFFQKNPYVSLREVLVLTMMGVSSGLPLGLTGGTLQAWLRSEGVDLASIGLFALVGLPYTWKFLWSPILDHIKLPMGRRRSWMLISQLLLVLTWLGFSFFSPKVSVIPFAILAFLGSFFSATQDIVLDAWRREQFDQKKFAFGNGIHVAGYLFSMRMISGAFALILSDHVSWGRVYQIMALIQCLGVFATFLSSESQLSPKSSRTLKDHFLDPLKDFFMKPKAFWILIFILLYKIGDNMAAQMSMPFYLDMGYTRSQVGAITKVLGWLGIALGSVTGGVILRKIRIDQGLFWFGVLQMISTAGFVILAILPPYEEWLSIVILIENFTAGLGTAAFVTFMGLLTNKEFTATQYALLTSLMGIPRIVLTSPTGFMAERMGWPLFFAFCTLIAIPGLLLSLKWARFWLAETHLDR